MKRPWALIVAVPAIAIVVALALQAPQAKKRPAEGRSPSSAAAVEAIPEDRGVVDFDRRMPATSPVADSEIPALVEGLFDPDDEESFERLRYGARRAIPALIQALDDPRTVSMKFDDDEERSWNDPPSPFARICELLEPSLPVAAAKPLAKFVEHKDPDFRSKAAFLLGFIGTQDCGDPVRKALVDEDEHVRAMAMIGMKRGLEDGRAMALQGDVFPGIVELLDRDGEYACELLFAIDAERAVSGMLSSRFFRSENRYVFEILRALNEAGRKIPHDKLLPLLEAEKALLHEEFPHDYAYAAALKAYAIHPDGQAEATILRELDSPNENVRVAAAEALAILSGVTDAWKKVVTIIDQRGIEALSVPQRRYYAVLIYDSEVNNGGHSQYFFNSSGELWEDAVAGLDAMGAKERAGILREAAALAGRFRPPSGAARTAETYQRFDERHASLDTLDDRYYECDEVVDALLARYALDNKEHFRPEP